MSIRRLALAVLLPLFVAGCMTQRDSTDMDDMPDDDMMESDTMEVDTVTTRGGGIGPNIAVYIYGTWTFTATEIEGDDTITGVLTIAEEQGASRLATSDGMDAPLAIDEMDVTNSNFVLSGTVQGAEPMSVSLAGSLAGDEMTAEIELSGRAYALTAVRR